MRKRVGARCKRAQVLLQLVAIMAGSPLCEGHTQKAEGQSPARGGRTHSVEGHPSVRAWSRVNNESVCSPEAGKQAIHYLIQLTNFRTRHIDIFLDDFKDDPDAALPHLQMFLTMPASSVAQSLGVVSLSRDASIAEAAAFLVKNPYLVIRGSGNDENGIPNRDALWDQKSIFFRLISCSDFEAQVHTILEDVPELATMNCAGPPLFMPPGPIIHLLRVLIARCICDNSEFFSPARLYQSLHRGSMRCCESCV